MPLMQSINSVVERNCRCDHCKRDLTGQVRYDARTRTGVWMLLCDDDFARLGVGLGLGKGQKFDANGTCIGGNRAQGRNTGTTA